MLSSSVESEPFTNASFESYGRAMAVDPWSTASASAAL